ncbi:hypothetical protein RHECNPAF_8900112 [Rhizobium etli CNPAF512]|nr:hypothetical protein RHECNPAF_8900112 [Rhizobium etli CNPAF512]
MTVVELFRQRPCGENEKPAIPFAAAAPTARSKPTTRSKPTCPPPSLPFIHSPAAPNRRREERDCRQKNQKIFTNTLAVLPRSA